MNRHGVASEEQTVSIDQTCETCHFSISASPGFSGLLRLHVVFSVDPCVHKVVPICIATYLSLTSLKLFSPAEKNSSYPDWMRPSAVRSATLERAPFLLLSKRVSWVLA